MIVSDWVLLCHDSTEHANYYEREVTRDDGKIVVQVASRGDGILRKDGKVNKSELKLSHQYFKGKPFISVRPMTPGERAQAIAWRGRGMGVEPSTVIVSLSEQHGFAASVCGDVDGGLGTYESDERSGQ